MDFIPSGFEEVIVFNVNDLGATKSKDTGCKNRWFCWNKESVLKLKKRLKSLILRILKYDEGKIMTDLRNQRRMAASLLKCGVNRVWMDHDRVDEIAKAVTKDDIRVLIKGKAIKSKQKKGISSGRKKYIIKQKEKGRRRGHGSRKGAKYARLPRKDQWIRTIRPIRVISKKFKR